ncbi:MAG: efflux RND transporter periplasmic adaptor subunit [Gammaproteobacteria bacterium]|nr:efflux RND transporter periplasmic adaptor subunit [Gammaproteobacteria bacterium]
MKRQTRSRLIGVGVAAAVVLVTVFWRVRPEPVSVVAPVRRDVMEVVVASGKIRAVRQSVVGAESAGLVESVDVAEGDSVKAGQLLGRLRLGETDARLAQSLASLRAAETSLRGEESLLDSAQRELKRAQALAARKLVPVAELEDSEAAERLQRTKTDSARARLEEAQAEVAKVRPEFGKREVRAPFDGVVIERLVQPGTAVTSSTGWFSIAEMSTTEIYVETDENNLGRLKVGQAAIAVAPAYPDLPFKARLTQVGPNVDSERGVVGLRLAAEALPAFILPNMTIDVNIEVRRSDGALALPASAVSLQGEPHVLALSGGGRLEMRSVRVLGRNPEWIAVEGLDDKTRVLREVRAAAPGARVRAVGTDVIGQPRG